jgi:hypothetical protein
MPKAIFFFSVISLIKERGIRDCDSGCFSKCFLLGNKSKKLFLTSSHQNDLKTPKNN